MLLALMVAAVASEPAFPLAVGNTWTYGVYETHGGGLSVLGKQTSRAGTRQVATWTLSIDAVDGEVFSARLRARPTEGEESSQDLKLVERDGVAMLVTATGEVPALEMVVPPNALASERVACVAHVLGGVVGTCPPRSGGPLGTWPGLQRGRVSGQAGPAAFGRFISGVATLGMLLPGAGGRTEDVTLTRFVPGPTQVPPVENLGPLAAAQALADWNPTTLFLGVQRGELTAEDLAAMLTRIARSGTDQAMSLSLFYLPMAERYAVVRTSMWNTNSRIGTLARVRSLLDEEIPPDQLAALRALLGVDERKSAGFLEPRQPLLAAVIAAQTETDDELLAVATQLLGNLSPTMEALVGLCAASTWDRSRLALLDLMLPRLDPYVQPDALSRVLETFSNTNLQVDGLKRIIAGAPEEQRQELLLTGLPLMRFERNGVSVVNANLELVDTLTKPQRGRLLAAFRRERETVRLLLRP